MGVRKKSLIALGQNERTSEEDLFELLENNNNINIVRAISKNKNSSSDILDIIFDKYYYLNDTSYKEVIFDICKHDNLSSNKLLDILSKNITNIYGLDNQLYYQYNETFYTHINADIINNIINNKSLLDKHKEILEYLIEILIDTKKSINDYAKYNIDNWYSSYIIKNIKDNFSTLPYDIVLECECCYDFDNIGYRLELGNRVKSKYLEMNDKLINDIKNTVYFCQACGKLISNKEELLVHIDLEQEKGHIFTNAYLLLIRNENLF